MTKAQEQIEQLIHLLHVEKTADYEQYQQKMLNTSVDERRKKVLLGTPLSSVSNSWAPAIGLP